jgi:hypothetical protein
MTQKLTPAIRLWLYCVLLSLGVTAALAGSAAMAGASTVSSHPGILPPKEPSRSLPPANSFLSSCHQGDAGNGCNSLVLQAIGHARQTMEKMGGMAFSMTAYGKLTPDEQLFVTVNLERTQRGLAPAVVLTKSLDKIAQAGAQAGRDPALGAVPRVLPGGGRTTYIGANWSGGWVNPLGSDYGWMYDDGPGSTNLDCSAARTAQCWGHRNIILVAFGGHSVCGGSQSELAMGAGHTTGMAGYGESDTEVLAGVCGPTPTDTVFTWTRAQQLLGIHD